MAIMKDIQWNSQKIKQSCSNGITVAGDIDKDMDGEESSENWTPQAGGHFSFF